MSMQHPRLVAASACPFVGKRIIFGGCVRVVSLPG
jgi:uncharacterized protein YbaA (DUF1428 family)